MREASKALLGRGVAAFNPQCRFARAVFVLGHMRCGSTALSNVLCSRPEISGYGEAHVRYDEGRAGLGRLVVNQARRRAWRPGARYLFDKILHDRHDAAAPPGFFEARTIFVARAPDPAIRSIRSLFERIGGRDYRSDAEAAAYYVGRMHSLLEMWARSSPDRRLGLTHAMLLADPDAQLARISALLALDPPLGNRYESHAASRAGGGGDPLESARHSKIVAGLSSVRADAPPLDLAPEVLAGARELYARFETAIGAPRPADTASAV